MGNYQDTKMQEKTDFIALFSKFWVWIFYILSGIIAKFSFDLVRGKKISFWQALGTTGISLFVGSLASFWCMRHSPDNGAFIVPVSTLLADKLLTSLFALDYRKVAADILGYWYDTFKGKK